MPRSTNRLGGPTVNLGLLLLVAGSHACSPSPAPPPTTAPPPMPAEAPEPSVCVVSRGDSTGRDTISIAVAQPVDSAHAPVPDNDAERVLFRQRYESPLRLDCEGGVHPGLATSWSRDSTGRAWTLVLRTDNSGQDGESLTADRLAAQWRSRETADLALQSAGVESVVPLDPYRLLLTLGQPEKDIPEVLADPALAMPAGQHGRHPFIAVMKSHDLRDALDRGADIVQSSDPALVEYARSRADRHTVPLPWDKTYVLLLPAGSTGLDSIIGIDSAAFRSALARDAVHGDARGAEPPFWWTNPSACSRSTPASRPAAQPSGAVVYSQDDRIARDLAERIVALAAIPGTTARGLSTADLLGSLQVGRERGYILALPRRATVPCRELAAWPPGVTVLPLVDTRLTAIVGRGLPRVTVDWDGALRIGNDSGALQR